MPCLTTGLIIVWGQSLGGGVAADVAQDKKVAAVILDSTFYSMDEMAAEACPLLPAGILLRYHLRTDRKLGNIHAPVLVIHSINDGIIPYTHGEKVFKAASEPKEFLKVTGSHIGAYFDCEQIYLEGIRRFLGRNVRAQ
ncbi:MAG: alpha/beta hydrolase [Nitrospirae bacterium]|nr:alpha/beta hydrolase [Nitrospirota bacterium]